MAYWGPEEPTVMSYERTYHSTFYSCVLVDTPTFKKTEFNLSGLPDGVRVAYGDADHNSEVLGSTVAINDESYEGLDETFYQWTLRSEGNTASWRTCNISGEINGSSITGSFKYRTYPCIAQAYSSSSLLDNILPITARLKIDTSLYSGSDGYIPYGFLVLENTKFTNIGTLSGFTFVAGDTIDFAIGNTSNFSGQKIIIPLVKKASTFTVSYNGNGGTPAKSSESVTEPNSVTLPNASRAGYSFAGWYTAASGGTKVGNAGASYAPTANVTLYAHWTQITCTINFDGNGSTGGSTSSMTASYGGTLTPNGFTRSYTVTYAANGGALDGGLTSITDTCNYSFRNWNTAQAGTGTAYANQASVNGLLSNANTKTLYAQWTAGSVTLATPTRTGYNLAGWYTAVSGGSKIGNAGASYTPTANITLYARWTAQSYTVTFRGEGVIEQDTKTVVFNSTYGELPAATRTGYTFAGWWTAASGGTRVTSSTVVTTSSDHRLYAHWTANEYTVSFSANSTDGTVSFKSKKVTFGDAYGDLPTATRPRYVASGWYTGVGSGRKITATSIVETASNHTLYAWWTYGRYTVRFNGNGATSGSMTDQSFTFGTAQSLSANTYTKTNYDFIGWATSATATTAEYTNGQTVTNLGINDQDVVNLYAVWRKKVYITIRSNNTSLGSVNDEDSGYYSLGARITLVATTIDSGKTKFLGWYVDDRLLSQSASYEVEIVGEEDTVYEARFRSMVHKLHVTDPSVGGDIVVFVAGSQVEAEKDVGFSVDVLEGQGVELRSVAEYNYDAAGWTITEDGEDAYTEGNYKSFTVTESNATDIYAAPQFAEKPKYTLAISKAGRGKSLGTVSLHDAYGHSWEENASGLITVQAYVGLTYTAQAAIESGAAHILFEGWSSDGSVIETGNVLAITQSEEKSVSVVANFKNTYHTLNVSSTDQNFCYLEAWSGDTKYESLTGITVADGQYITVKATLSVLRYLDKWQISNVDEKITDEVRFQINDAMGDVVSAVAVISEKDSDTFLATKDNGNYGTIQVSYDDVVNTQNGTLENNTVVFTEDSLGKIQGTIYSGVNYTALATVTENLSDAGRQLSYIDGWYALVGTEWIKQVGAADKQERETALSWGFASYPTVKAVFAAYPLYGVTLTSLSEGGGVDFDREYNAPDVTADGVPQWLAGQNVKFIVTPNTGYEINYIRITKADGSVETATSREVVLYNINSSHTVEVYFERMKCPVTFGVDSYSLNAGNVTASVEGIAEPDFTGLLHGDVVTFSAEPNEGYRFDGWYSDGIRVSTSEDYTVTLQSALDITAKFKAQVTLTKSSSVSASGTVEVTAEFSEAGEPENWIADDGTSASTWVTLGEYCGVRATASSGAFGAWYDHSDTEYKDPVNLADTDKFQVLDTVVYVARFISEDDYQYIALFNAWVDQSEADSSVVLGELSMTKGTLIDEAEYNEGIRKCGYTGETVTGAYAYYRFLGSQKSLLKAVDLTGRVFNRWELGVLVDGAFTEGTDLSEDAETYVNTFRNFKFTAFWGTPKPVLVGVRLTDDSRGLGTLRFDGNTEEITETAVLISAMVMQGEIITVAADATNGYKFVGWYEDALGTHLVTREQNYVFEVKYSVYLYAKFEEDRNAIYLWEGSDVLKAIRWKSKTYVATKPFDPGCVRIDAAGYPVGLKIGLFSAPDTEASGIKDIEVVSQDARRLPRSRPERFSQITVESTNEVSAVFVATSMTEMRI